MRLFLMALCLFLFSAPAWGKDAQGGGTPAKDTGAEVNFGAKGGFTSSLFLVSDLVLNGEAVGEVQNNYKIGWFGSLFMRVNFGRHFLQPELSYAVTRCNIAFLKPLPDDAPENAPPQQASITSSIHSFEVPVIYGYNIIKQHPYSLAVFGGPKLRYIPRRHSDVTFDRFDQRDIREELYPLNMSLTLGVAVTISPVFFDFRYDMGLHNISRRISYKPAYDGSAGEGDTPSGQIRFQRRENVLSFSLGVFF